MKSTLSHLLIIAEDHNSSEVDNLKSGISDSIDQIKAQAIELWHSVDLSVLIVPLLLAMVGYLAYDYLMNDSSS